ncbi:MAG: hypothetical protein IJU86_03030 [Firmicutes bacterium]|nr:hypothetical protein [Bacillota bacterium]
MKKQIYVPFILFFVIFLSACSQTENENSEILNESISSESTTTENIEDKNLDNLEDKIDEAHKAASYFYFDNTSDDYYDKNIFIKGNRSNEIWYKVTDERFSTVDAAKKYLGEYFSDELVDTILGQAFRDECIKSKSGELYIVPCVKDTFESRVESEIKEQTEDKVIYSIDVQYFDKIDADSYKKAVFETEKYSFVCEKINGKWLFTKFSYVW